MGRERFANLAALLPHDVRVVGVDEHTGLLIDLASQSCAIIGRGGVTVHSDAGAERFERRTSFGIERLGPFRLPQVSEGIPPEVWASAQAHQNSSSSPRSPGEEVTAVMARREEARARGDWDEADRLRKQIASMGWSVIDSAEGPRLEPNPET